MKKINLGILFRAIISDRRIFRGNRDDWGSGAEAAFELCERMVVDSAEVVAEIEENCTVGVAAEKIRAAYHCGNYGEGIDYLVSFKDVVLCL